jgi:lipoic acid synthetase
MMLGLSRDARAVLAAMEGIAAQGTHILTLGQYSRHEHLPIRRYVHPTIRGFKRLGETMGFKHVESGPLVRSSYHAFEQEEAAHS